ncbi:uncharacterized protein NDAI_0C06440 [Naumovozyma dairenensis CBS 421]|uniref:Uncharacterized protein n=1 Tax=Naumovozyma dairenensis (strain ATCC 10597 / BCRC 20456 / CBS 421 / NBRC 0211 / NRRL Y-12639) TaxID=1071378 RepID=G0W942_NAUDC|nr:hypothetical protein NDAI_0C06440 [Naumovozyma dairenensis CBS 421]CCD24303.1 hypothetical protein NDAI_0C06440 [Naumovozyma dairenensis CBS 421]
MNQSLIQDSRSISATNIGKATASHQLVETVSDGIDWKKQCLLQKKEIDTIKELNKFLELERKIYSGKA